MLPPSYSEAVMAIGETDEFRLNTGHPDIMRSILAGILATGDVLGRDASGRTVLAVAVDDWLLDEMARFGSELEDMEPEPDEDDDPAEDEEEG
jgi:hypothetical protein